jgi:hypothetical protein
VELVTRRGYEVYGVILLLAYLYVYSIVGGVAETRRCSIAIAFSILL